MAKPPRGAHAASLLSVRGLRKSFSNSRGERVEVVSDIDFDIAEGETLGLVGESGCGKTTVARSIIMLPPPTSGQVLLEGVDLMQLSASELRATRRRVQMVFQDPVSSLNPRHTVGSAVLTPLQVAGLASREEGRARAKQMLEAVGLDPDAVWDRMPHELSGGQCQRISIARALILQPRLLLCDEPVSSLDVSVQAQILNLLEDAKARFGLTLLFVAHDLAVVKNISDRIAVMFLGRVSEIAPAQILSSNPAHPYTQLLLAAMPGPEQSGARKRLSVAAGEVPSVLAPPSGCRFRTRCPRATDRCASEEPRLQPIANEHHVACHYPG